MTTEKERESTKLRVRRFRQRRKLGIASYSPTTKCPVCGEDVKYHHKTEHFKSKHPEILFTKERAHGKTLYECVPCGEAQRFGCFKNLVAHWDYEHGEGARERRKAERIYQQLSPADPMQNLDNFFGGMGQLVKEVKTMRELCDNYEQENTQIIEQLNSKVKECENWKAKTIKWSEQVVAIQELLARPEH